MVIGGCSVGMDLVTILSHNTVRTIECSLCVRVKRFNSIGCTFFILSKLHRSRTLAQLNQNQNIFLTVNFMMFLNIS
jgi:hypothetical protein